MMMRQHSIAKQEKTSARCSPGCKDDVDGFHASVHSILESRHSILESRRGLMKNGLRFPIQFHLRSKYNGAPQSMFDSPPISPDKSRRSKFMSGENSTPPGERLQDQAPVTETPCNLLSTSKDKKMGTNRYVNGDMYEGELKDEVMKHGNGTYTYATSGSVYKGQWKDDVREGKGKITWSTGDSYTGDFKEGKEHGMGIFTWKNGNVYEGEFENSQRHGMGTMRWASGNAYVGQWVHGKKHGKGMYKYVSGGVYEGDWNGDERRGKGQMLWSSGETYAGEF